MRAIAGWSELRELQVITRQPADADTFLAFIASVSWVAALPEERRTEVLAQIAAKIGAGDTPSEIPVMTTIFLTSLA